MTDGLSAGDVLALTRDRDDDGYMMAWMNNPFIYFVWSCSSLCPFDYNYPSCQ